MSKVLVIINPVCGARKGLQFVEGHVLPLLEKSNISYNHRVTTAAGDAGSFARDHVSYWNSSDPIVIVAAGGDGTLHEVVDGLFRSDDPVNLQVPLEIILVPVGTANALYSSLFSKLPLPLGSLDEDPGRALYSVQAYLASSENKAKTPLALQRTSMVTASGAVSNSIISTVVTSTSFHASILHTAETLRDREDLPGIERFKEAAKQNISNWYYGKVVLSGVKGLYSAASKSFEPASDETITLGGPFVYFLSAANVDRLEPQFQITPLQSRLPRNGTDITTAMDVILLRPGRHRSYSTDTPENRMAFAATAMGVMGGAYKEGEHVDYRFHTDSEADSSKISADGDGPSVIEYFRCSQWEWIPQANDDQVRLVCADGTILHIEPNGLARCEMLGREEVGKGVSVWT
jgi:hypothetical protein